ncbi:MAG TPA: hypothetical protein VMS73_06830 [Anaerolineaceae bacterium]|nr:hypothetical protein [Anaerolineaceae bacterium]
MNSTPIVNEFGVYACRVCKHRLQHEEVRVCLERPEDLSDGPSILVPYVVSDDNLITARY